MLKKVIFAVTALTTYGALSSTLMAGYIDNLQEIHELAPTNINPNDLKVYLQNNAPDLVQFISTTPTKLEAQLYGTITQSQKPVLVKFYLKGCGPCIEVSKVVEKVAKIFNDSILIINIELTKSYSYLMEAFHARGVPTLVFFKDGKKMEQFTGTLTQAELTTKINKLVN